MSVPMQVVAIGETSKSLEDGTIEVALKVGVVGRTGALDLAALAGKQVNVMRSGGEIVDVGVVRAVAMKKRTKDADDAIEATAKIAGGRAFQKVVGLQVQIENAQPDLPLSATRTSAVRYSILNDQARNPAKKPRGKEAASGA